MCMIVLLVIVSTVVVECEILLAGLGLLALKGALLLSAESRRNSRPSYQKQHYYYYPKKTHYDPYPLPTLRLWIDLLYLCTATYLSIKALVCQ